MHGQKIWTSRALYSDLMLLLARTTPLEQVEKKTEGLSTFIVDMKQALADGTMTIRPIKTLMNHATTEIFFDGVEIPADALVGEEGKGFRYILDGMNAERILIAAECIGDGRWFIEQGDRVRVRAGGLRPSDRANQGIQFPIAEAHAALEAADLMRYKAAWLFEQGLPCGPRPTWPSTSGPRRRGRRRTPASTRTAASASPRSTTSSASSARTGCTRSRRSRTTSCSPTSPSTSAAPPRSYKVDLQLTTPPSHDLALTLGLLGPRLGTRTC